MDYYEIKIDSSPEEIDSLCLSLEETGITGYQIEDEADFKLFLENNRQYWDYVDEELENSFKGLCRIKFWIDADDAELGRIKSLFPSCGAKKVSSGDWENNWKEYYKPLEIGKFLVIPEWERDNPAVKKSNLVPLVLDPGLIFGTGSHPTTKMCLEALGDYAGPGKKVLDLGCGSGILGIGAMVLGVESCAAIDIDEKAPDVVRSNAALNGVEISAVSGDVINAKYSGYDIVLANIVADVIIALSPKVRAFMAEDAVFICSGIIDGRESEVEKTLLGCGFKIEKHLHSGEWNAYICN